MVSDNGNGNGNGDKKSRGKLSPPFDGTKRSPGRPRGSVSFRSACMRAVRALSPNATNEDRRRVLDDMISKQIGIVLGAQLEKDSVAAFKVLANIVDGQRVSSTVEVNDMRKAFDWTQLIPSEAPTGSMGSSDRLAGSLPGPGNGGPPRGENGNGKHD